MLGFVGVVISELLLDDAPRIKFEDGSQVELLEAKFVDWPALSPLPPPPFFA